MAATAAPDFLNAHIRTKMSKTQANQKVLVTALEMYWGNIYVAGGIYSPLDQEKRNLVGFNPSLTQKHIKNFTTVFGLTLSGLFRDNTSK